MKATTKDIAKKVWIKLFHPLPKGSLVRIRNKSYKKGFYIGRIYRTRKNLPSARRDWCYVIIHRDNTGGFVAWVDPESITEVIRFGKGN